MCFVIGGIEIEEAANSKALINYFFILKLLIQGENVAFLSASLCKAVRK